MTTFLTVPECLGRLPVRLSEREFRKRVKAQGLCYKNGHQIALSEDHLNKFIETLACPTSGSHSATGSGKSRGPSKSQGKRKGSGYEKALALLD